MLLVDGGHALEHHFIILPVEKGKSGVTARVLLLAYTNVPRGCAALRQRDKPR